MLDSFDHWLLEALLANAHLSAQEGAEHRLLSPSQIGRRRQRLQAVGGVTGYRATLAPERFGLTVEASIQVTMAAHTPENADDFRCTVAGRPR